MMAAHDTTASALSSAVVLLAQHPQWQDALRREQLAPQAPCAPTERLAGQPLLGRFIREVLRLHPPVAFFQRQAIRDVEVDGVCLPKGAVLSLAPLHVQRDGAWWPEADDFNPERHIQPAPHPYAWAPFGGGPHLCLGAQLADAQMRLVLGELLRKARLWLAPGQVARWRHAPLSQPVADGSVRLAPLN